jgi:hypothetical protein
LEAKDQGDVLKVERIMGKEKKSIRTSRWNRVIKKFIRRIWDKLKNNCIGILKTKNREKIEEIS